MIVKTFVKLGYPGRGEYFGELQYGKHGHHFGERGLVTDCGPGAFTRYIEIEKEFITPLSHTIRSEHTDENGFTLDVTPDEIYALAMLEKITKSRKCLGIDWSEYATYEINESLKAKRLVDISAHVRGIAGMPQYALTVLGELTLAISKSNFNINVSAHPEAKIK